MPAPLPIDPLLPEILEQLRTSSCLVVEAAPGAGKTTRLPRALYEAAPHDPRQILVTEPRRLAARLAARYVSQELGCALGDTVGYSVRFEEKTSARTRVRYMTEGVLLRQLLADPDLPSARVVILDEFHERHLDSDQLLVLLAALAKRRPDFRLIVMSATLNAEPVARYLGNCPRVQSQGRAYPLEIRHVNAVDDRPLEKRVSSAVKEVLSGQPEGHVLVFLPGIGEIERVATLLKNSPQLNDVDVFSLHGEMPLAAQASAVEVGPSKRRKVVLSTNVAESSITVDGVRAVVDSGLARVAAYSPWTGRSTLETKEVSQSSGTQRAGRAGRTGPGLVLRLYSEGNFKARPLQDTPELQRLDLTELVLSLYKLGHADPALLDWLDTPPAAAIESAQRLLRDLGAVADGALTPIGQRMLALPLPPRLARVVVEGEALGIAEEACLAAALLAERDIRPSLAQRPLDLETGQSDLQERIDRYRDAEYDEFSAHSVRALGLDAGRVAQVRKALRPLLRQVRNRGPLPTSRDEVEVQLRRAVLSGFCDRVARRAQAGGRRLTLASGTKALLSEQSVARHVEFMVALDVEERSQLGRRGDTVVSMVSAVDPDWLLSDYSDRVEAQEELSFSSEKQRVVELGRLSYGSVVLEESRQAARPSPQAAQVLWESAKDKLSAVFGKHSGVDALLGRIAVMKEHLPEAGVDAASSSLEALLKAACQETTSLAELADFDYAQLLLSQLSHEQQRTLSQEVPEHLSIPGGRRLSVNYEPGKPPWVASRLQDFFGMKVGPRICRGRVPVTLHLLAPNQRAVQVTSDLPGFWERHYAEIRKELRRRYPRHPWPEDGANAEPPPPRAPRVTQK